MTAPRIPVTGGAGLREALIDGLWVLGLDVAVALDLGFGTAQHPALMALFLAYLNFFVGYGIATAERLTAETDT